MQITHFGHACVLVELPGDGDTAATRLLIDPGSFSTGLSDLTGIDAILITHEHIDHADPAQVKALRAGSAAAPIWCDPGGEAVLREAGIDALTVVEPGLGSVGQVAVEVGQGAHELVHPDLPTPRNNSYLVAGRVLHPGDWFAPVEQAVDVLLLPTGAPWMKLSEAVDYLRVVRPAVAIPIHQGGLVPAHQQLHYQVLRRLAPPGTEVVVAEQGSPITI